MTQQDYIKIAKVFSYANKSTAVLSIMHNMSDMLQEDNPKFNKVRFLQACVSK